MVLLIVEREIPWRTYLTAGVVVAPWLLFSQLYFGSVLPNTLDAKTGHVDSATYLYESLRRLIEGFLTPFQRFEALPQIVMSCLVLALVAPVFSRTADVLRQSAGRQSPGRRGAGVLVLLLVVPILQWLGYGWIGPPLAHRWYLVPGLQLLVLFCLLAWAPRRRRGRGDGAGRRP